MEWNDRVKAQCKKAIPGVPNVTVGQNYEVFRERTSPAGITCTIRTEHGVDPQMNGVEFEKHFTVLHKMRERGEKPKKKGKGSRPPKLSDEEKLRDIQNRLGKSYIGRTPRPESGTFNAKCIKKMPKCPTIKVGEIYRLTWERTSPAGYTCSVDIPNGGTHTFTDRFDTYFTEVGKSR